jgi:hypothetical protein
MTAEATFEATLPLVSILLATCRPDMLAGAVRMMSGQTYRRRELVVPLHGCRRTELPDVARRALADAGATVLEFNAAQLLPEVLTAGAEAAKGSIIAKIDDDDIYGPGYLEEAVQAIVAGKGDVTGKSEVYVHFAATRELLLWRPGSSGQEQNYVMGGTVTFRRELARSPGFGHAIPEMPAFLERCSAMGLRIYATSRRNFLLRRHDGGHRHSWHPDYDMFRREGILVRRGIGSDEAELLPLIA